MPDPVDLSAAFGLPPDKAIDYFKAKGYAITWSWQDMWQEAHAKAFTVAKVMNTDILQDIRGALDDALKNGTTLRDFQKNLTPVLQAKGWWGKTEHVNTLTGEVSTAQLGSPRRLQTIYQTNLQTAYMAGRYQRMMEATDSHPYWEYVAVMDRRTRPTHAAMNGSVYRYDDPIWNSMYPPNGFNCRCRVSALSDTEVKRDGIKTQTSAGRLIDHPITLKDGTVVPGKALRIKVNGQDKLFAPDAGWSYNPGKAALPNIQQVATQKLAVADPAVALSAVKSLVQGPSFQQFYNRPQGAFPVAMLEKESMQHIGAQTGVVQLSSETMSKQFREHPELSADEYSYVQDAISQGREIQDSDTSLIFLLESTGYVTVVKATKTGKAVFMTSLRRLSAGEVKRNEEIMRLLKKDKK